jgi:uncharacterized membrane-anchored protein
MNSPGTSTLVACGKTYYNETMIQFYFLSIFCNAAAGYILIRDGNQENNSDEHSIKAELESSANNDTIRLFIGVLALITGVFKLLSAVQGDIPILGDIIPAFSGFGIGFMLVFEYCLKTESIDSAKYDTLEQFLLHNKKRIGFLALGVAVIHFLFPQVLFI